MNITLFTFHLVIGFGLINFGKDLKELVTNNYIQDMHNVISSYDNINIKNNSLILCDIDETVLKYNGINREWWKQRFYYHYDKDKDYDKADINSLNDWKNYIYNTQPTITDNYGFRNFIDKINETNSTLYFITARDKDMEIITEKHFNELNIDFYKEQIHYVGINSKGAYIKDNFKLANYNTIIFIDDREVHLNEVKDETKDIKEVNTYHFIMDQDIIKSIE